MSNVSIPTALPRTIEQLLSQRESHVSAIATIDATLARVTAALGGGAAKPTAAKAAPAPKAKAPKAAPKPAAPKAPAAKAAAPAAAKKPGKPSLYAMTANDLVLSFITSKKNPTSQEVSKHWKDQGRKGTPDNTLSMLTKTKKLKRSALGKGQRGSRYSVI